MKLTVLGCSGTFPGPDSPCSSYLLQHDGFTLLVDAGNGSTSTLQQACSLLDVDAVAVSHLHGDHYLDLVTLTYARRYHPRGPVAALPVYGPVAMRETMASSFGRPVAELLDEVYGFREFTSCNGSVDIGPFTVQTLRMNHPVETNGMRITAGGRTLAYSADTGSCDELVELAKDADLLLCEASYLDGEDNPSGVHLTGVDAGEHARRAGARRLVLTHLVPWGDADRSVAEAASRYDGPLDRARTGMVVEL